MANTTVQPYLFFDGNCAEAVAFYAKALGAETRIMTFGDSPMATEENKDRVMHASINVGDATIFASDGMPGTPIDSGMRAHISIGTDDVERGRRYFEALSAGGQVTMAYEKQFWGDTYGMLTDRFGVKWMVNANPNPS
ncbi:MAG: VOC family protein [Myxococcales bacterium]|nr:VOC family protein [Myxococcales bacterium]